MSALKHIIMLHIRQKEMEEEERDESGTQNKEESIEERDCEYFKGLSTLYTH